MNCWITLKQNITWYKMIVWNSWMMLWWTCHGRGALWMLVTLLLVQTRVWYGPHLKGHVHNLTTLDLSIKLEFWSVLCNIIRVPLSMILMRTTDKLQILTTHESQTSIPPGSTRTHSPRYMHTHPHTRKPIKIHITNSYSQAQRRVEYVVWNVITYDTELNDYTTVLLVERQTLKIYTRSTTAHNSFEEKDPTMWLHSFSI